MTDKEKVVKSLETCSDVYYGATGACSSCSFSQSKNCFAELVYQTIELLKEQGDEITALSIALALYEKQDIVRCKDCRHYKPYTGRVSGNLYHECEHFDMDIDDPEWFCANAERRVNQDD